MNSVKPMTVGDLIAQARPDVTFVSVQQAMGMMKNEAYLFVDIREQNEVETGKIPGSVHAPRGMFEFYLDPDSGFHRQELTTEKTLVLICGSGRRATLAAKVSKDFAVNALCMEGGIKGWKAANGPLE